MTTNKVSLFPVGGIYSQQLDNSYFQQYYKDCTIKTSYGYWYVKNGHLKVDLFTSTVFAIAHILHLASCYQLYHEFNVKTYLWCEYFHNEHIDITSHMLDCLLSFYALLGAHRLWSHRSYSATVGLRIFLMVGTTMSVLFSCATFAQEHRVHHKWNDTDADPYNSRRGYVFCHVGWLVLRKHPEFTEKQALLNYDDLAKDPVIRFQNKYD